jgi:hypothetical protein
MEDPRRFQQCFKHYAALDGEDGPAADAVVGEDSLGILDTLPVRLTGEAEVPVDLLGEVGGEGERSWTSLRRAR